MTFCVPLQEFRKNVPSILDNNDIFGNDDQFSLWKTRANSWSNFKGINRNQMVISDGYSKL